MDALKAGLANVELTDALSDAILSFVRISHDGHQDTSDTIQNLFCHLPCTLRQEIKYKLSRDFLCKIPSLASLDQNILEYISNFVEENIFLPGDYIVSSGEFQDHAIYIFSGSAVVIDGKNQHRRVEEKEVIEARSASELLSGRKTGVKYPEEARYDCIAETVVIVYRLPIVLLGHVLFSLAGHMLDTEGEEGGCSSNVVDGAEPPSKDWEEIGGVDGLFLEVLQHPQPSRLARGTLWTLTKLQSSPSLLLSPSSASNLLPPSQPSQLSHPHRSQLKNSRRPYRPVDAITTISGSDKFSSVEADVNNQTSKTVTWSVVNSVPLVSL